METVEKLRFKNLRFKTFTEAFNAISRGNGYFIPVSEFSCGKLERKILARYPNWDLGLEDIITSGACIGTITTFDNIEKLNIFSRPHIEYADLIFKPKGESIIFCDLMMMEAQECLFVKYERRCYSHYITLRLAKMSASSTALIMALSGPASLSNSISSGLRAIEILNTNKKATGHRGLFFYKILIITL